MKKLFIITTGIFLLVISCTKEKNESTKTESFAQTITLMQNNPAVNAIDSYDQLALVGVGTQAGVPNENRAVFYFQLKNIKANNVIDSAFLYIHPFLDTGMNINGDNTLVIKVIEKPVDVKVATWNNMPPTDLNKQLFVSKNNIDDKLITKINVSKLVKNDNGNFDLNIHNGLLVQINNSNDPLATYIIRSGKESNKDKKPRLEIFYH